MEPLANEGQLIAQAQAGDKAAVSALYQAYVQAIHTYINYRVESDAVAEDLTAEVFVRMVHGLPQYRDYGAPFGAWLYRIAATRVADHYRQHKRLVELTDNQPSDDTDPFGKAAKNEERARLRAALAALPPDFQTLLILRFMQEQPHAVVAAALNKSEAAIRVMQHRALNALAQQLGAASKVRSYLRGKDTHE